MSNLILGRVVLTSSVDIEDPGRHARAAARSDAGHVGVQGQGEMCELREGQIELHVLALAPNSSQRTLTRRCVTSSSLI